MSNPHYDLTPSEPGAPVGTNLSPPNDTTATSEPTTIILPELEGQTPTTEEAEGVFL